MDFFPEDVVFAGLHVFYGALANVIEGNKKGQPLLVDLDHLVEPAGIEPASVSPLLSALHA